MSDDLIRRQDAIDALDGEINVTGRANAEAVIGYVKLVADRFKRLPSVQPSRKTGKWVLIGSRLESRPFACSECNYAFQVDTVMGKTAWRFCPNCGVQMEGENDG